MSVDTEIASASSLFLWIAAADAIRMSSSEFATLQTAFAAAGGH